LRKATMEVDADVSNQPDQGDHRDHLNQRYAACSPGLQPGSRHRLQACATATSN
jgi:hypothetical protein